MAGQLRQAFGGVLGTDGEDVVVVATQPDSSPDVRALIEKLEVISMREMAGVPVIDVPAVLARHPQVALVDGLAYDNPAGSPHQRRFEDIEDLLQAGISRTIRRP